MTDKELKDFTASFMMLTVQFSAMNQILMGLLMVLDPAVLKSIQAMIQEPSDTLEEGTVAHHATSFALAQLDLAINGPTPKKRLTLLKGKKEK